MLRNDSDSTFTLTVTGAVDFPDLLDVKETLSDQRQLASVDQHRTIDTQIRFSLKTEKNIPFFIGHQSTSADSTVQHGVSRNHRSEYDAAVLTAMKSPNRVAALS